MQRREEMALGPRSVGPPKSQVGIFVELGHVENPKILPIAAGGNLRMR